MCIVHILRRPLRGKQWSLTPSAVSLPTTEGCYRIVNPEKKSLPLHWPMKIERCSLFCTLTQATVKVEFTISNLLWNAFGLH